MKNNYVPPIHPSDMFRAEEQLVRIVRRDDMIFDEKRAIAYMYSREPLRYFCPNGAQEYMIDSTARAMRESTSDLPIVLSTYANGVGKTTTAVHILMNIIYGPQNGWFDYPEFRHFYYPRQAWYCSTADALKTKVVPLLESLLIPGTWTSSKDGKTYTAKYEIVAPETGEGFIIHLKTYDQDAKTYESSDVGVVICDEPMPEALWKPIKSRRREGCLILLPMTPLYCEPYIVEEIMEGADSGAKDKIHLEASVYDACWERGVRGHLSPGTVDGMCAEYDDDEKEARAYGRVMYYVRSILGSVLNPEKHFVSPEMFPIDPEANIVHIVDPHDGKYSASAWMAVQPNGRKIFFLEYPEENSRPFWTMRGSETTTDEVGAWVRMEGSFPLRGMKRPRRIMDKRFGWQTRGDTNFATLYAEAGEKFGKPFSFQESYSLGSNSGTEIQYGHARMKEALSNIMQDGYPEVLFWNTCVHMIRGLTHYTRKNEKTEADHERAVGTGKIIEKFKDFPDVFRYGICAHTPYHQIQTAQRKAEIAFEKELAGKPKEIAW